MGVYTQSLREIIQFNKRQGEDIFDVQDLNDIAHRCIFDKANIELIDSEFRDHFITGFTMHYFNDEIGIETLPLWKMALNEKLYNNYHFINLIYDNLDKQIFADYKIKQVSSSETSSKSGSINNTTSKSSNLVARDERENSETESNSRDVTLAGTGTITNAKTGEDTYEQEGTDTVTHTGTDSTDYTGSETIARTGTDANAHTGTENVLRTGTDTSAHTGTQSNEGSTTQETTNTGTTSNDTNNMQIIYDTPQGSLSNVRTPGGDAKGTGVSYTNSQTYNYMSQAVEQDNSNVQTDNTTQNVEGTSSDETTFDDTTTVTKDLNDLTTYNDTHTETRNLSDLTTKNLSDTTTKNLTDTSTKDLTDTTTYGSTDTETRNTTDTTKETSSGSKSIEEAIDRTSTQTDSGTDNTTNSETGSNSGSITETDHSLNWDMLHRSESLLNQIWDLFDDLFMQIY